MHDSTTEMGLRGVQGLSIALRSRDVSRNQNMETYIESHVHLKCGPAFHKIDLSSDMKFIGDRMV